MACGTPSTIRSCILALKVTETLITFDEIPCKEEPGRSRGQDGRLTKPTLPAHPARPLFHLRRWRWIDAVDMFEFGGLRRHGAHRSSDMLILSTVAQTSSPRHSPGWPDLKLSPHPI